MKVTKSRLKQIIKEELGNVTEYFDAAHQNYLDPAWGTMTVATASPNSEVDQGDVETQYEKIQEASRIIENLPLKVLPEEVELAAKNLRTALDILSRDNDDISADYQISS